MVLMLALLQFTELALCCYVGCKNSLSLFYAIHGDQGTETMQVTPLRRTLVSSP